MCDEVYRGLTQEDGYCESIADLYEKGISVSSMSKVFSLGRNPAGPGIACKDPTLLESCLTHRDYNLISCGMIDEAIAAVALQHSQTLLARNQAIVRDNLKVLDDWVQTQKHIRYTKPSAGTTALLYYDFDFSLRNDFCKRMYDTTGAFVTPGDCRRASRKQYARRLCLRSKYSDSRTKGHGRVHRAAGAGGLSIKAKAPSHATWRFLRFYITGILSCQRSRYLGSSSPSTSGPS